VPPKPMRNSIFLGRTQEQEQFRTVLRSLQPSWFDRNLPTFLGPFRQKPTSDRQLPFVLLFYGEGGMGKTTLMRRLRQILETEKGVKGAFNTLFLDWEEQQKQRLDLSVGHDHIRPETVLEVLHKALVDAGWERWFESYRRLVKDLQAIEFRVDQELRSQQELQSQPNPALPKDVLRLGAKGIALVIRQSTGLDTPVATIEQTLRVSAEGLHQARQFVQKMLSAQDYDTYARPHERLAEALGKGIAALATQKPLVILLDTYEIVDRPKCDYTMRTVMRYGGHRVVWAIAGRSNLAESERRGAVYFQGYQRDFPDDRMYAKALSQFSLGDIQTYFQHAVPGKPITPAQADALSQFSLGIPFVISEAAAMWREGKPIDEIVEPVSRQLGQTTTRAQVVKVTSERFLKHCFQQERDLQAVYALAIMRAPNVELLKVMLEAEDLERELQRLRDRYSFIWVEQVRLDEKLAGFVREYLLEDVRRTSPLVRQINARAIAQLQRQIERWSGDLEDTADYFKHERLAEALLDLIYHHFWQEEDTGWRHLLPRFIEGWLYDPSWARSLLDAVALFAPTLSQEGQRRLELMTDNLFKVPPELDRAQQLLAEIEKLAQRAGWNQDDALEREVIVALQKGQVLYRRGRFRDALTLYLDTEGQLPQTRQQLKLRLSRAFEDIGYKLGSKDSTTAIASEDAKLAFERAVVLDPKNASAFRGLGIMQKEFNVYEQSIQSIRRSLELRNEEYPQAWDSLGNTLSAQQKLEEAIAAYHKAIELKPDYAIAYYNLGTALSAQQKLEEAIAAYHKAIELNPDDATAYYNLGNALSAQQKLEEAIAAYHKAIELNHDYATAYNNLGWIYLLKRDLVEAKTMLETAIRLEPKHHILLFNFGLVYALENNLETAKQHWQQGIALGQDDNDWDRTIRVVYAVALGEPERGIAELQATIQSGASVGALNNALGDAEILAQAAVEIEGIDQVIELLRQAIEQARA
jgi:tetratricopeptide (TPR) repeat protein